MKILSLSAALKSARKGYASLDVGTRPWIKFFAIMSLVGILLAIIFTIAKEYTFGAKFLAIGSGIGLGTLGYLNYRGVTAKPEEIEMKVFPPERVRHSPPREKEEPGRTIDENYPKADAAATVTILETEDHNLREDFDRF